MKKLLKNIFFTLTLILLSSCQLVIDTTTTTTEKQVDIRPLAVKIQADNLEPEYYQIYYNPINPIEYPHSSFLNSLHIHVYDYSKSTVDGSYFLDLDGNSCITLTYLTLIDYRETKELEPQRFCGNTANISHITKEHEHHFNLKLVDIDMLESIEIIQFNEEYHKTKIDNINLNDNKVNIILQEETFDFIIIEKYRDMNGDYYFVRNIHTRSEVEDKYNSFKYHNVIALNKNNERMLITLEFNVNKGGSQA